MSRPPMTTASWAQQAVISNNERAQLQTLVADDLYLKAHACTKGPELLCQLHGELPA